MRLNKRDIFEGCSSCNNERLNELLNRLREELDPDFLPGLYDPTQPFGPDGGIDSDGDGVPDWIEKLYGSDPNDPDSKPATGDPNDLFLKNYDDFLEWYQSLPYGLQVILEILIVEVGIYGLFLFLPGGQVVFGVKLASLFARLIAYYERYEGVELLMMIAELLLEIFGLESDLGRLADCILSGGSNCFDKFKPEDFDIPENPLAKKQFPDLAPSKPNPVITPPITLPSDLPPPTQPFGPGGNNPTP
jgi:hypothetical protein